jgi:hypothetical protein
MNTVFSFLLTPLGRYVALGMLVICLTGYGIHLIREQAVAEIEAKAQEDALKRIGNAVTAGDAVNINPDRVRDSDGHKRD